VFSAPEESHARALPEEDAYERVAEMDFGDDAVNIDSVLPWAEDCASGEQQTLLVATPNIEFPASPLCRSPTPYASCPSSPECYTLASHSQHSSPDPSLEGQPVNLGHISVSASPDPFMLPEKLMYQMADNEQHPVSAIPATSVTYKKTIPARRTHGQSSIEIMDTRKKCDRNNLESSLSEGPSKKARKKPASDVTAPAWFTNSIKLFRSENLGNNWVHLLEAWTDFERQEEFKDAGRLSSKGRPAIINMWISCARSTMWRLIIDDLKVNKSDFETWWASLQPEGRVLEDGGVDFSQMDVDWGCLRKPGINGVHSVVAALFYWGVAPKTPEQCKGWLSAIADCSAAFRMLSS